MPAEKLCVERVSIGELSNKSFVSSSKLFAALVFDFIVVGSGAGGSTVARQLLDSPEKWKILIVEAGGDQKTESVVSEAINGFSNQKEL